MVRIIPGHRAPACGDCGWGVRFTSTTAGFLLNDAPAMGTSHDYYWEGGQLYYFGGAPVANFSMAVDVDGAVTGTGPVEDVLPFTPGPIRPNPAPAGRGARVARFPRRCGGCSSGSGGCWGCRGARTRRCAGRGGRGLRLRNRGREWCARS